MSQLLPIRQENCEKGHKEDREENYQEGDEENHAENRGQEDHGKKDCREKDRGQENRCEENYPQGCGDRREEASRGAEVDQDG